MKHKSADQYAHHQQRVDRLLAIEFGTFEGQHYPNVDYLTGGYGARAIPGPRYCYRHNYYGPGPAGLAAGVVSGAVGTAAAIAAAPLGGYGAYGYGPYAYYDGPVY